MTINHQSAIIILCDTDYRVHWKLGCKTVLFNIECQLKSQHNRLNYVLVVFT